MLVNYECDCPPNSDGVALVVKFCDDENYNIDWFTLSERSMGGKKFVPLDVEEERLILSELLSLIGDGYKFRKIQRLLVIDGHSG